MTAAREFGFADGGLGGIRAQDLDNTVCSTNLEMLDHHMKMGGVLAKTRLHPPHDRASSGPLRVANRLGDHVWIMPGSTQADS